MLDHLKNLSGIEDLCYYSSYATPDGQDLVRFSGKVPEEAFGKYVYRYAGLKVKDNGNEFMLYSFIRSKDRITSWGGTDNLTFSLNDDGKGVSVFSIWKCDTANIPSKVVIGNKTYRVTTIGEYALEVKDVKSLVIPSTVTIIGDEAFKDASKLKSIRIDGQLKAVGEGAFSGINKNATIKIKATKANYNKIVKLIKESGVPATVKFKRITK